MRVICLLLLCLACITPNSSIAGSCTTDSKRLKAVYFTPDNENHPFWGMQIRFAQAVAKSIDVELDVVPVRIEEHNRFDYLDFVQRYLENATKPDIVMGIFYLNGERRFLEFIEKEKIYYFSVNTSLTQTMLNRTGYPREKYPRWLGHISPKDRTAGYRLARHLVQREEAQSVMLAIAGENQSLSSFNRENGLLEAQAIHEFALLPSIHTNWTAKEAKKATQRVLEKFQSVNTIWTAGSQLGTGVVDYLADFPQLKNQIRVGTFDWTSDILKLVGSGDIYVSYGGHFKEAGLALILIADYFAGIDFKDDTGVYVGIPLEPATQENALVIAEDIENNWRHVDFTQFQKCRNPEMTSYSFLD